MRFVDTFVRALKRRGFEVWVDANSLRAGEAFWEKIGEAIAVANFVIVVLLQNSLKSAGVSEELRTAHISNLREIKIVPIRIDPISFDLIPVALRSRHVVDFVGWEQEQKFKGRVTRLAADLRSLAAEIDHPKEG